MGYQLIEHIEVGSGGAASIEFTSIPQDGVDLHLVLSGRDTGASILGAATINNVSTGYNGIRLEGSGSAVASSSWTNLSFMFFHSSNSTTTANTFDNCSFYFSNYAGSTAKSVSIDSVYENNATQAYAGIWAWQQTSTAAITSVKVRPLGDVFAQYSTASLYKITAD